MEICHILPTLIYKENLEKDFSEEIKALTKDEHVEKSGNVAHHFSVNKYVLNSEKYLKLKGVIEDLITKYFYDVLQIDGKAMITQSWVNANLPGEFTHQHIHPNSFASGVLYLSVSGQNAGITFHRPPHQSNNIQSSFTLQPKMTGKDSGKETLEVKNGDIIIFPSYLAHSVQKNTTEKIRWSMAFNSLTKDSIGDSARLTEFRFN
jgi:uncharacterized protein (TIGR02466 family)